MSNEFRTRSKNISNVDLAIVSHFSGLREIYLVRLTKSVQSRRIADNSKRYPVHVCCWLSAALTLYRCAWCLFVRFTVA